MKRCLAEDHLKRGYPLIFEWDGKSTGYFYLAGHCIADVQAKALIRDLGMIPSNDAFFGLDPQTWRLP